MASGAVVFVATFEVIRLSGFTLTWWGWITGTLFGWSMMWFGIFVVGTIWNLIAPWPEHVWSSFWHVQAIAIPIFMAVATSIWFTWGGVHDIRDLLRRLKGERINHLDDGTVVGHQNLDERAKIE